MSRYYEASISSNGLTLSTGLRQSINTTLDISGSAIGEGRYYRYTDTRYNDVSMKERIYAGNGTIDTAERVRLIAEAANSIEFNLVKYPNSQTYSFTVNESWPVAMSARRSMDYVGQGIWDRETFGNNQDCLSTSYLGARDLLKNRATYMDLRNAYFEFVINDTTHRVLRNRFLPAKTTLYHLESRSNGTAVLKYGQITDQKITQESYESYSGDFSISRVLALESSGRNFTRYNGTWLSCAANPYQDPWSAYDRWRPYLEAD